MAGLAIEAGNEVNFLTEDEIAEARASAPILFSMIYDRRGRCKGIRLMPDCEQQREQIEYAIAVAAADPKRKYRAEFAAFDCG